MGAIDDYAEDWTDDGEGSSAEEEAEEVQVAGKVQEEEEEQQVPASQPGPWTLPCTM